MGRQPHNNEPGTSTTSKHTTPAQKALDDTFERFFAKMADTAPQKGSLQTAKLLRQIVDPLHHSAPSKSNRKPLEIAKYVEDWMDSNGIPKYLFAENVAYWEMSKFCWNLKNAHLKRVGNKIFGILASFCDLPDNARKRIGKLLRNLKEEQDYKKEMNKEKKSRRAHRKTTIEQDEEILLKEFRRKVRDASSMDMDDEPADLEAAETLRQLGQLPARSLDPMEFYEPNYQEEVQMARGVSESDDDVVVLGEVINYVWRPQEEIQMKERKRKLRRPVTMDDWMEEVPKKKLKHQKKQNKLEIHAPIRSSRILELMEEQKDREASRLLKSAQNALMKLLEPNSSSLPNGYYPDKSWIGKRLLACVRNTKLGHELWKQGEPLFDTLICSILDKSADQFTLGEKTSLWKIQKLLDFVENDQTVDILGFIENR